jgi:Ca2+-binding RTX toxin-like protein
VPVTVDLRAGTASGQGADELRGIEGIWGSREDDVLRGDEVRNAIVGSLGDDELQGRGGRDVAIFSDVTAPVTVDLAAGTASGAGTDTLGGFEDVWGTNDDDVLLGNGADNVLLGLGGNDDLAGRAGDDILDGGDGADFADGGAGDDVCLSSTKTTGCEGP